MRQLLLILVFLTSLATIRAYTRSSGCSNGSVVPSMLNNSTAYSIVTPDGRTRTYRIFLPGSYTARNTARLVFFLHGGGGSGLNAENYYGFDANANTLNMIVVYPDGTGAISAWNAGGCCGSAVTNNVDDVLFISILIDTVAAAFCIDTDSVYATGMSNGAMLAYRLACDLSYRISAIAPVEGSLVTSSCTPSSSVSLYAVHGTYDTNVPFYGGSGCGISGYSFQSVPFAINSFTSNNQCGCVWGESSCATNLTRNDGSDFNGNTTQFGSCTGVSTSSSTGNIVVELVVINNGSHTWSGSAGAQLDTGTGCTRNVGLFPASLRIAQFFNRSNQQTKNGAENQQHLTWSFHILLSCVVILVVVC